MNPAVALYGEDDLFLEILLQTFAAKNVDTHLNPKENASYSVFVHFNDRDLNYEKILTGLTGKALFVFSALYGQSPHEDKVQKLLSLQTQVKIKVIYLGDLYSPSLNFLPNSRFKKMFNGDEVTISPSTFFYPLSVKQAAEIVVRELFTYSHGQDLVYATKTTEEAFFARLKSYNPELTVSRKEKREDQSVRSNTHLMTMPLDDQVLERLSGAMKTIKKDVEPVKFPAKLPKIEPVSPKVEPVKTETKVVPTKKHTNRSKKLFIILMIILWFILTPFVSLAFSAASLYVGAKALTSANLKAANVFFTTTSVTSYFSSGIFSISADLPVVNGFSQTAYEAATLLERGAVLGKRGIVTMKLGSVLVESIVSGKSYDVENISSELFLETDALYKESSLALGQYNNLKPLFSGLIPQNMDLNVYRNHLYAVREISRNLGEMLGSHAPKTYLVLLQNNMELRATGGFIGSFALVTFENGKLIDTNIFDVYSADGQLKGFVAPPAPIEKYLGEATWHMRDSNWDPDFVSSAKKIEWFLDKSINRQVDGVIGVNLEVLKSYLEVTGPLEISDFADTVTADNFYQKIQFEVEEDFFPGSRKKAHYLTALTNEILDSFNSLNQADYLPFVRSISRHLESRDIQIYLHEPSLNKMASVLGWSGELAPACNQNSCFGLWGGLIEDNLGVNKANVFIDRRAQLNIEVNDDAVNYVYRIVLQNESKATGQIPEFGYKAYLRLLANPDARFEKVIIQGPTKTKEEFLEIISSDSGWLEAGTLVEVNPQQEVMVTFAWTEPVDEKNTDNYKLYWRKQSGVNSYPFEINLKSSQLLRGVNAGGSLTSDYTFHYNTALDKDIELSFEK